MKKQNVARSILAPLALTLALPVFAAESREALKKQISQIYNVVETNYGPLAYKQSRGLRWNEVKTNYLTEIDSLTHSRDYYFMMARFFSQLQDAHVSVQLPSNYTAELPAQFSFVEGKTILNWLSPIGLQWCKSQVGDELVTMDGKTPDELRSEFSKFLTVGKARSNQSYLTYALTARNEARGLPVSNMNLKFSELVLVSSATRNTYKCTLPWKVSGVPLIGRTVVKTDPDPMFKTLGLSDDSMTAKVDALLQQFHKLFNADATHLAFEGNQPAAPTESLGRKQVIGRKEFVFKLPDNAVPLKIPAIMQPITQISGSGLQAAIIPYKGKRVAVLRIPSYMGTAIPLIPLELRFIIGQLERSADMLLIDQTHNPGGAVAYSDWLVSSLTGKLDGNSHMKFLVRPRQNFLRMYAEMIEMIKDEKMVKKSLRMKYEPRLKENLAILTKAYEDNAALSEPVDLSVFSEFVQEVLDDTLFSRISELPAFARGLPAWLSGKLLDGVDITKHQVFTKPVYMLVDELDFSGGDATPAVLQDYGRVKIVGVATAGAGGTVEAFQDFMSGFGFHLTTSLMYRKGGVFVENLGVTPEFNMEPSISDFQNDFRDYFTKVMEKISL